MRDRLIFAVIFLATASMLARAAEPVDWNRLDWRLDRAMLVSRYLFHDVQPTAPWQDYLSTLNEGLTPSVDDLADFDAQDPATQDIRRREAEAFLERARIAILDRAMRLRDDVQANRTNSIGDIGVETPGFGIAVTTALGRLDQAAAKDATNVEVWYHLAYFSGLVGDLERTERAQDGFLAAWERADADTREACALYNQQIILDRAWLLRDAGRYQECLDWLAARKSELPRTAESPMVAPYTEGLLIRALVHAERGEGAPARALLPHLPLMDLPSRSAAPNQTYISGTNQRENYYRRFSPGQAPVHSKSTKWENTTADKLTREHRSSSYLRKWVKAWTNLERGHVRESILRDLGRVETELEFQPRLAWRWWQDQGLIYEKLGEIELAKVCWARAAVYRPFFIYYPLGQGNGISSVHGLRDTGQPYYLAYGTFFTAGSLWSYAANAALASQVEYDPFAQAVLRDSARRALDACIRRGLHADEARVMRGRLAFLAEDYAAAEQDLQTAWDAMAGDHRAPGDLLLMLGLCHFNRNDWQAARPWLETFVAGDPDAHVGWQALGMTEAFLGDDPSAFAAMNRAVDLAPDNATYLYNRGLLNYRAGRHEDARRDFKHAGELWPDNPQIAQMLEVASGTTQYDLDMDAAPVRLDLPEKQRHELEGLFTVGGAGSAGELADLASGNAEDRHRILAVLRDQYAAAPTPVTRQRLAQGAMFAGEPEIARATLAPLWPHRLLPAEARLLLLADRAVGDTGRAAEIAARIDRAGNDEDVELLILAATILMDHDQREQARRIVEYSLDIAPDRAVLQDMHRSLGTVP